ncbi:MAG: TonB-dependent receptor, partial [Sphingobacteriia bacterium]
AYLNFKQGFGTQWELVTGLRTEQTVAKGKSQGQSVLNRNYWQLFPSVYLTRKINKDLSTVLQYTRRVNRPSFQQQNPFIEFLDSLTYTRGNPLLRPETSNQYKIGLNYQNQPFFSVSYNQTLDVIFENAPQQEGNLTFTTPQNLARYDNLVFELNFPLNIGKKISGFGGNQFIYNHYKADYLGTLYERQKWNWQAYWQVAYKPRADWSIELSGFYTTNFLSEFVTIRELGNLNIAIQKTFWQKRGRITLNLNDVFFTQRSDGELKYQAIDLSFRQRNETRNARLSFFYSFGNQQLRAARNRSVGSDAETGRVKTN